MTGPGRNKARSRHDTSVGRPILRASPQARRVARTHEGRTNLISAKKSRFGSVVNVIWGQGFVAATTLVGMRLYTELLEPRDFGAAMIALGLLVLFDSIGVMALNQTLLSQCGAHQDRNKQRCISAALSRLFLKWALPIGASAALALAIILSRVADDRLWMLLPGLAIIYLIAETIRVSVLSLVTLNRQYGRYSIWLSGEAAITLAGTVLTILIWRQDEIGFLAGYAFSRAISCASLTLFFSPGQVHDLIKQGKSENTRTALRYGLPVALMGPLGWVSSYLDRYILGALLGVSTTGSYVAATGMVARPYSLLTATLSNYFRPLYFEHSARQDKSGRVVRVFIQWTASAMCLGLVGVVLLGLISTWLSTLLLAKEYRPGAPLLMTLFALSQTAAITTHAADNAILALGRSRELLRTQTVLSATTLLLIPIGIIAGGVIGGIVGRCSAECVKMVVTMLLVKSATLRSNQELDVAELREAVTVE